MAKIKGKGTILSTDVDSVLAPIAQIISIDLPDQESETFESDTLDNTGAGILYQPTGRTEGGSASFEFFLDPVLAGHAALTDLLTDPCTYADNNWKTTFADAATTEWTWIQAGFGLGGAIALSDGVKMTGTVKLNGIVTFP